MSQLLNNGADDRNGFAILSNAGGAKLAWYLDPLGGSIIALIIIGVWTHTAYEQFTFLAGITAPPDYLSLVTYKVSGNVASLRMARAMAT